MAIQIALDDTAGPADFGVVERGLIGQATESGIEPRNHRVLNVFARNESGRVVGGLVDETVWGWLQVKQLFVAAAHRGQGHGTALLQAAEREAERRCCHHVFLDTFDFQAREFYEGLGYVVFGSLADFPRGHVRFFMREELQ